MANKIEKENLEKKKKETKQTTHHYHMQVLFTLFCFIALLGISTVFIHEYAPNAITGAAATTINYNKCTDYGNYIILQNDAGWRKVKKDICTGFESKYIQKVACIKPEETGYNTIEKESYVYTYTKIAHCENARSCALDTNGAAYCPKN